MALSAKDPNQAGRAAVVVGPTHQTLELADVHILGHRSQEWKKPSDPHASNGASSPAGLRGSTAHRG